MQGTVRTHTGEKTCICKVQYMRIKNPYSRKTIYARYSKNKYRRKGANTEMFSVLGGGTRQKSCDI